MSGAKPKDVELAIRVDRPEPSYSPGEHITGHVRARATRDVELEKLVLTFRWRAGGGDGDPVFREIDVRTLELANLREHEERTFDFDFALPDGPFSYGGTTLNVSWYLDAHTVPWRDDARLDLRVAPRQPWKLQLRAVEPPPRKGPKGFVSWFLCAIAAALFFAPPAIFISVDDVAAKIAGTLWLCGYAAIVIWALVRRRRLQGLVLRVEQRLASENYRAASASDGGLVCTVRMRPSERPRALKAILVVAEHTPKKLGRLYGVESHVLHTESAEMEPRGDEWVCSLPIPELPPAALSLDAGNRGILWTVEFEDEGMGRIGVVELDARPASP